MIRLIFIAILLISFIDSNGQNIQGSWLLDQLYVDSIRHFEKVDTNFLQIDNSYITSANNINQKKEFECSYEFDSENDILYLINEESEEESLEYNVTLLNECVLILEISISESELNEVRHFELRYARIQ